MEGMILSPFVGEMADGWLYEEEERALGRVAEVRRREFVTGRGCARRALAELGAVAGPVGRGAAREPIWPAGVVGSITHCRGYAAAAVAWAASYRSVGIDAEPNEALDGGVLAQIASEAERGHIARLGGAVCWDRLLFSAKESLYKAWYPLAGRWLGFEDARVSFEPAAQRFVADVLIDGPIARVTGRYAITAAHVVTCVAIDA